MADTAYFGYTNGDSNGMPHPPSMLPFAGHENFTNYGSLYPPNGLSGLGSAFSSPSYSAFNNVSQPPYASQRADSQQNSLLTPPGSPEEQKTNGASNGLLKPVPRQDQLATTSRVSLTSDHSSVIDSSNIGSLNGTSASALTCAMSAVAAPLSKRQRAEKKPIPEDLKDDKYFERRKRNNLAAKRSRDNRKTREDEIAIRASYLEKENAILRAQVNTLREEANSLRHLLIQKRAGRP